MSSLAHSVWPRARRRLDVIVLGALLAVVLLSNAVRLPLLGNGAPGGIAGLGVVSGSLLALQAIGVVLVWRSNRIINFAQVQLGVLSGALFYELVHHVELVVLAQQVCGPCFHGINSDPLYNQSFPGLFTYALVVHGYGGWVAANFWISLVISVALAPLLSWLLYVLVIRFFRNAPRLIATVATIAMAQLLVAAVSVFPNWFNDVNGDFGAVYLPLPRPAFYWAPKIFRLGDDLGIVIPLLVGLGLSILFLRSRLGVAMLGSAENVARALSLGINVDRLASLSWALAGAFSGFAAIIAVMRTGQSDALSGPYSSPLDATTLVQILAAAVFARLTQLPLAVIASIALGVIGQVLFWNFSSATPFEGVVLLPLMGGALLLQASGQSRAEQEAAAGYLAARETRPIPRELKHLPVVENWLRYGGLALAAFALGYPFFMAPDQVSLGSDILIFAIVGLSILILTGWAGQVSLGQFAFAGVGGYVTALIATHFGLFILINLLLAGIAGAAVAALIGIPALRLRGVYLAALTMAFALTVSTVLLGRDWLGRFLPGSLARPSLVGFSLEDERGFYFLSLAILGLALLVVAGLRRSHTARALIAARDNEQASQSFGISLFRARLEAFAVSGFMAAVAGGLFAYHEHGLDPSAFAPRQSMTMFLNAVIGGMGSLSGPLLGSIFSNSFYLFGIPLLALFVQGFGVLLVLMLYPGGLSGLVYAVRDAWLRRVAVRYRVLVPSLLADLRTDSLERRALIAPEIGPGGGTEFVPVYYRLRGQWQKFKDAPS